MKQVTVTKVCGYWDMPNGFVPSHLHGLSFRMALYAIRQIDWGKKGGCMVSLSDGTSLRVVNCYCGETDQRVEYYTTHRVVRAQFNGKVVRYYYL